MPVSAVYPVDYGGERQSSVYAVDYGVTADGVTNDRVALQAAIDDARATGKKSVLLPVGTILIRPGEDDAQGFGVPLLLRTGVSLIGAGRGATILKGQYDPGVGAGAQKNDAAIIKIEGVQNPSAATTDVSLSTSTTGGTLAAATYSYRVAAVNAEGQNVPTTAKTIVTTGTTSTVTITWGATARSTSYKVYGRTGGSEQLIATVQKPAGTHTTVSYTDTGSVTPSGAIPTTSTTGAFDCGIYNLKIQGIVDATTDTGFSGYEQTGIKIDEYSGRLTVDNVWIDQVGAGFLSRGANRIHMSNVLVTNVFYVNTGGTWGIGVWFWNGTSDVVVNNVIIDGTEGIGFCVDAGDPGFGARVNRINTTNLTIRNWGQGIGAPAYEIQGGSFCSLSNFIIDGGTVTGSYGINMSMDQTGVNATDNIVSGGTISNTAAEAIVLQSAQRNSFSNVRIVGQATTNATSAAIKLTSSAYASPLDCTDNYFNDIKVGAAGTVANYTHGVRMDAGVQMLRNTFDGCSFGSYQSGMMVVTTPGNVGTGANSNVINEGDYSGPKELLATTIHRYQTASRLQASSGTLAALVSGRLTLVAIELPAGLTISSITFVSGGTAASSPTNQLFGLYLQSGTLLATTSNGTTAAWAANTEKSLSLTTRFVVTDPGVYFLGIMVTATTVPTLTGNPTIATRASTLSPALCNSANTGLTTALPNPFSGAAALAMHPYAGVS